MRKFQTIVIKQKRKQNILKVTFFFKKKKKKKKREGDWVGYLRSSVRSLAFYKYLLMMFIMSIFFL
jgi:hypothetical protein